MEGYLIRQRLSGHSSHAELRVYIYNIYIYISLFLKIYIFAADSLPSKFQFIYSGHPNLAAKTENLK